MTVQTHPSPAPRDPNALDIEWQRLSILISIAEATRQGHTLPEDFAAGFDAVNGETAKARQAGIWAPLAEFLTEAQRQAMTALDLDILVCALACDGRPSLAPRIAALQPQISHQAPSLAFLQEVLMLDSGADLAALFDRLSPRSPLVSAGLITVEGDGAAQAVKVHGGLATALLGRPIRVSAPPGAHLNLQRGTWADLILPDSAMTALKDYLAWIEHRRTLKRWGVTRMGGPLALFAGPSGTGKTFAAAVLTQALNEISGESWSLYSLDLGRVMSKYVGETEENLNRLLDALNGQPAILQIDEADGLLGKRGEISDARDRYANLEVSHMLSRFERHDGPVILTTNLRSNIDPAFLRRFQLVVDFPAPDRDARQALWARLIPPGAPRQDDLDFADLAEAARLSGGAIHNAAQYSAILAAARDEPLAPHHIARAVWAELNKDNRQVRRSELGALSVHLEGVL
ncbi:ATP-binding protein [Woodsholea maritima]|uniref:ATP-binding protein n=1 Tax=Woodsholea maritima TaxID=240237 RepID=UPI0003719FA2|nr:ATP-binding protein [Woodsholea maritima]